MTRVREQLAKVAGQFDRRDVVLAGGIGLVAYGLSTVSPAAACVTAGALLLCLAWPRSEAPAREPRRMD